MRLDPKYFNLFIGTIGVVAIVLIGYFTLSYYLGQHQQFIEEVGDGAEFREFEFPVAENEDADIISVAGFEGRPVVLNFWATWASRSLEAHEQLHELQQQHEELVIVSALVKEDAGKLSEYRENHSYEFTYVHGTEVYQEQQVPGVPTYLMYDRGGELIDVIIGYRGTEDFSTLISYLEDG